MAERRLAITKRISLADISDGWDDCYAIVRPATYGDYAALAESEPEKLSSTAQIKLEMDFVKSHLVSGKIRTFASEGQTELVDMEPADVEQSTELANKLFFDILGVKPDPKDLLTTTATS